MQASGLAKKRREHHQSKREERVTAMSTTQTPEVVVITGAAAGVGRAAAIEFAKHGAHIGLIARGGAGMDGLEGARRDVEAAGGKALMLPVDVVDAAQVEAAAAQVEET